VETLTDNLIGRVDELVLASKAPLLSTTPTSIVIGELVARTEALEIALREIAVEVERLSRQSRAASKPVA